MFWDRGKKHTIVTKAINAVEILARLANNGDINKKMVKNLLKDRLISIWKWDQFQKLLEYRRNKEKTVWEDVEKLVKYCKKQPWYRRLKV